MTVKAMSGSRMTNIWNRLSRLGVLAQAGLVSGVVLCVWLVVAPLAYRVSPSMGLVASATAAGICLVGAALALASAALLRGPSAAMQRMLLGMFARALLPLLLGVALHVKVPALADAGMIFYLLVFYLATLVTETLVMLAQVPRSHTPGKPI